MPFSRTSPYDELPPLPPAPQLETVPVLKATIEARSALARLDASSSALRNPAILINTIPLLEAQASSAIENIVTTTDELFTYSPLGDAAGSPATREALRYRTALRTGFELIANRPLTSQVAVDICATIRGHDVSVRTSPVMIGNPATREARYTPPADPAMIRGLLANWDAYVNDPRAVGELSPVDPLVRMAVSHYQFEAIHPFTDGNGRTGRILNSLLLCQEGLLRLPILYLSRYIIARKDEYYRLLDEVTTEARWVEWVLFMIEGVRETSQFTLERVEGIRDLADQTAERMRQVLGSVNSDLLGVLFEQPYSRVRDVMRVCAVSRPTATNWLGQLVDGGVLRKLRVGRENLFINQRLMGLLVG